MMMLDRKYSAEEIATIAARGMAAMAEAPDSVVLAALVASAAAMMEEAEEAGPVSPPFHAVARALRAAASLCLHICETGPVPCPHHTPH